jgi:hypothetical protein
MSPPFLSKSILEPKTQRESLGKKYLQNIDYIARIVSLGNLRFIFSLIIQIVFLTDLIFLNPVFSYNVIAPILP